MAKAQNIKMTTQVILVYWPVCLKSSASHKDKYVECCFTKPIPIGSRLLCQTANQKVHFLDVTLVQLFQQIGVFSVWREFLKGFHGWEVRQSPELVISWDTALSVAYDVDGSKVNGLKQK